MGFSAPKYSPSKPEPLPAPAATPRAPTIDGPVTNPGVGLSARIAAANALNGRQKLLIPLNPVFGAGTGVSIPGGY